MNTTELIQTLTGDTLSLSRDNLGAALGEQLLLHNEGKPIVLGGAARSTADDGTVKITGRASFASVPDLPVVARFGLDAAGDAWAELRFQLRGAALGNASPWVFSRSFPGLPSTWDQLSDQAVVALDQLDLFDTWFVLRTVAGVDADTGAPLVAGLNIVSHLWPRGALGVLGAGLGDNSSLVLYGQIRMPQAGDLNIALRPQEYPWQRLGQSSPPPVPGLYLQIALSAGFQGRVALRDVLYRIYSPISDAWMDENPGFVPIFAYTAKLDVPSAGIQVALGAELRWGAASALLTGDLQGVSLGKLDQLLDLAGTGGLLDKLPGELKPAVGALEKLELMHVGLDLVLVDGVPTVRTAFFTIGFPNLKWKVWKDDLVVESLRCRFAVFSPFAVSSADISPAFRTRVATMIEGVVAVEGVSLAVSAGSEDGFIVRTSTLEPFKLGLQKFVGARGPNVPVPSALTINYLGMAIAPGRFYAFDALLASNPEPWTLTVGKARYVVSDVALQFEVSSGGATQGLLSGRLDFVDGVTIQVAYRFPGSLVLRSRLPPMKLSVVTGKICDKTVKLPGGFDLALGSSTIVIQQVQGNFQLQLMAEVGGLGVVAFDARRAGGAMGFAYGLQLSGVGLGKVPGLGALGAIDKAFKLQKLMIVVSSMDLPSFQLPDAAQLGNPALATKSVALPAGGGVVSGLNVFAEWTVDAGNPQQKLLKTLLGLGTTEQVTIQVPENPANGTRLFLARSGKIMGQPFQYKVGMVLDNGVPAVFLTGTLIAEIASQPVSFDVTSLFVASGLYMSATMKNTKPVDLKIFKLANVALEVGVNWAGLPSLGITGIIDVKNFTSSVAIFFDANQPTRSLVAGSVSDLTLKDITDTLLGGAIKTPIDGVLEKIAVKGTGSFELPLSAADDLDQLRLEKISAAFLSSGKIQIPSGPQQLLVSVKRRGELWHLTDLTLMRHYHIERSSKAIVVSIEAQIYFAPQVTTIGTNRFPARYYLNGAIEIDEGWRAEATVEISPNQGFRVDARMDRLVLGKGLFALTSSDGKAGPELSISTMSQPDHPIEAYRLPHVYVNGAVQILGLNAAVLVSITVNGMEMRLEGKLAPGVVFELDVVGGKRGLAIDGGVKVGVGSIDLGALGKVKLDTDVEGSIGIRVNGDQIAALGEASFEFLGEEKTIGRFEIGTSPDALARLGQVLTAKVEDALRDEFADAGRWANAVKNGVVDGVEDAEAVLKKTFGKSEKEAKAVANDIAKGAKDAKKAVKNTVKKTGKKIKKLF